MVAKGKKSGDGVAKVEGDGENVDKSGGKESGGGSRGVAGPGYCRCRNWWIALRDKQFISIIITIGAVEGYIQGTPGLGCIPEGD
jgi:hypothetical protein